MSEHVFSAGRKRIGQKKSFGPKLPTSKDDWFKGRRLFVVLELASLETAKTRRGYELLCSESHSRLLLNHKREASMYRPDIVHQALLTLQDSPLNKAGLLKVLIRTQKNVIIDVNPRLRVPRTYRRFAGLMVQLLYQKRIRSTKGSEKLLKIVKNPVQKHLPPGAPVFGTSVKGDLVDARELVAAICRQPPKGRRRSKASIARHRVDEAKDCAVAEGSAVSGLRDCDVPVVGSDKPVVFVFGAHPHGPVHVDYTEHIVALSQYPLSAAAAISRLLTAFETVWDVL